MENTQCGKVTHWLVQQLSASSCLAWGPLSLWRPSHVDRDWHGQGRPWSLTHSPCLSLPTSYCIQTISWISSTIQLLLRFLFIFSYAEDILFYACNEKSRPFQLEGTVHFHDFNPTSWRYSLTTLCREHNTPFSVFLEHNSLWVNGIIYWSSSLSNAVNGYESQVLYILTSLHTWPWFIPLFICFDPPHASHPDFRCASD